MPSATRTSGARTRSRSISGAGARPTSADERGEQRCGAHEHRDHDGRRPAEQPTALRHREQQQHDRAGQERRAQPVDRLPMALDRLVATRTR